MSKAEYSFELYLEGVRAIQEALYLYKSLIVDWGYFANDLDVEYGDFSIDKYIDCDFCIDTLNECDQAFLREASAIKLICELQDSISINEGLVEGSEFVNFSRRLVKNGRLKKVGLLGKLIEELLNNERIEPELAVKAFDEYVVNKFKQYVGLE